jgi:hypothetical protein
VLKWTLDLHSRNPHCLATRFVVWRSNLSGSAEMSNDAPPPIEIVRSKLCAQAMLLAEQGNVVQLGHLALLASVLEWILRKAESRGKHPDEWGRMGLACWCWCWCCKSSSYLASSVGMDFASVGM